MAEYGRLRQDDSGHWYLIPESEVEGHDGLRAAIESTEWLSDEWNALTVEYDNKYYKYRLGGGPYELKVLIE